MKIELINPVPHQRISLEQCHLYKCCVNCVHFACSGMSAPDGVCKKTYKHTNATRHCNNFEECKGAWDEGVH